MALAAITFVASVSAGPPWGGLYLKPPSYGGLWLGVTTIPSARPLPVVRPWLSARIERETAGVGVYPSSSSTHTSTSLATSTSMAVAHAGSESACGSRPISNGPSYPCSCR